MVTILRVGQLKYKVNRKDHNPPHVHVEGGGASLRVNLLNFNVMDQNTGFSKAMVRRIILFIEEHHAEFLEKWMEYHEKS
ncbi:DUF4160 domain-containing protein [Pseudobdellovibrio exovorus]|uniref:DUF4160 domain-containing protein n=1 Tax=Pseudobdellovibrio exovorus JSS TaxID=1184267 RepID=M4VDF3_9BACT|nr:DUF4160 domain-containing protein [Pseudobdellovibrio exovorus]AGH96495.1 hypothetical protein A11Q_2279 [Pseudobdellovibrio exovorus JSS]